jgi:hypothetical protein
MLHYHVWFNLKPEVAESSGLAAVRSFLAELTGCGEAVRFELLRNKGEPPRSKLPRYHALVAFRNEAQFETAMKNQAARGIHTGPHGGVVDVVTGFHVEIFTSVEEVE